MSYDIITGILTGLSMTWIVVNSCNKPSVATELKIAYINACSTVNKGENIEEYILDENLDLSAITETWLRGDDDRVKLGNLVAARYHLMHVPLF